MLSEMFQKLIVKTIIYKKNIIKHVMPIWCRRIPLAFLANLSENLRFTSGLIGNQKKLKRSHMELKYP